MRLKNSNAPQGDVFSVKEPSPDTSTKKMKGNTIMSNNEALTVKRDEVEWDNSINVVSGTQKFILPVGELKNGGEPLIDPDTKEPIVDWQGKPIGDKGVVFRNIKDQATQGVPGDGTGVIIFNEVNEEQATSMKEHIDSLADNPNDLSTKQIRGVIENAKDLGLKDCYPSDKEFIANKMTSLGEETGTPAYGWHKRDDRDLCQAALLVSDGNKPMVFEGATQHKADEGHIVAIRQPDGVDENGEPKYSIRGAQTDVFLRTYKKDNGQDVDVQSLPRQVFGRSREQSTGENAPAPQKSPLRPGE